MARDAIQQLLNELLAGVIDDSAAGQMASGMLAPFMRLASNWLTNSLTTGTKADILLTDILDNPTLTSAIQSTGSSLQYADTFGRAVSDITSKFQEDTTASFFRALGYSEPRARHERYSLLGQALHMGSGLLGKSTWEPGFRTIGNALHSRRYWMETADGVPEDIAAQVAGGESLLQAVHKSFLNKEYGRLSMQDVGNVVQRAVDTGAFDRYQEITDLGDQTVSRVDRISGKIKSTSKFMERLKDVFSGDLSQLLTTMDQVFGGNALNMSEGRLGRITKAMQHMALITGTSEKSWREMGAIGYQYIAPHGGTTGMGAAMANTMAYYNAAGISVDGLTKSEYTASVMASMANQAIQGEPRLLAAAYRAANDAAKASGGKELDFREFVTTLRNGDGTITREALLSSIDKSVAAQYGSSEATAKNRHIIAGNYIDSAETTKAMEEYDVFGELQRSKAVELDTARQSLVINAINNLEGISATQKSVAISRLSDLYKVTPEGGSGLDNKAVQGIMRKAVLESLPEELRNNKDILAQLNSAQIVWQRDFSGISASIMPGATSKSVEQFMISSRKAVEASKRKLMIDEYSTLFTEERLKQWRGARGFEGLVQNALGLGEGEAMTLAQGLASWSGIDMNMFKTPTKAVKSEFVRQAALSGKSLTDEQKSAIMGAESFDTLEQVVKSAGFTDDEYTEIFGTSYRTMLRNTEAKYSAALTDSILPFVPKVPAGSSVETAKKLTSEQFVQWSAVRAAIEKNEPDATKLLTAYADKYGSVLREDTKTILQHVRDNPSELSYLLLDKSDKTRKDWERGILETTKIKASFADIFEQNEQGKLTAKGTEAQNAFIKLGRELRYDDDNRALVLKAIKSGNIQDLGKATEKYSERFQELQKILKVGDTTAGDGAITDDTRQAVAQMVESVVNIGAGPLDMVRSILDGLKSMVFKVEVNK